MTMMITTFHKKNLLLSIGLFLAIVTLLASPTKADCKDDPDYDFKPPKNGKKKGCQWIARLNEEKKNKICNRTKKGQPAVRDKCPETCGNCDTTEPVLQKECPEEAPLHRDCSAFVAGLTCDYNYEYFGGCGETDPLQCEAKTTYYCNRKKKWKKSELEHFPCVGDRLPEVGFPCDPKECPLEAPENGSACLVGAGKTCYYDYAVMGCTADDATCTAIRFFDCTETGTWIEAHVDPPVCGPGLPDDSIGGPCDPGEFCTAKPPMEGSPCTQAQEGLSCPHNSVFVGCNFQDGYMCTPQDHFHCSPEQRWEMYRLEWAFFCPDPVKDNAMGLPCETCPEVKPEKFCPAEKPTPGSKCSIGYEGACEYDFKHTGCSTEELECTSSTSFFCENGLWQQGVSILPITICPPTGKECPKEPPRKGPCRLDGYDPGLNCDYNYKDVSCDQDVEKCVPTEHWLCTEYSGWIGSHTDWMCLEYPDDFGHACSPEKCPVEEPEHGEACTPGASCGYGYQYTGCTQDDVQCSPQRVYTCGDKGTWDVIVSLPVPCPGKPPPIVGDRCDPLGCPYNQPEHDSPCDPAQIYFECPYYAYQGCTYAEGFQCTEKGRARCTMDLKWDSVELVDMCVGGDPDSVHGQKCEPCPEVEPVGICPPKQPSTGGSCDIESIKCDYDFVVHGCSADELQCMPQSFSHCLDGEWRQGVYDLEPCPPRIGKPCPVAKPDAKANCRLEGHDIGLQCDYEYRDHGCDDETVECVPTEFYTCTYSGWEVATTSVACPGGDFPDKFGRACICPDEKAESGDPCDDLVGLWCGYDYVNTSCDENVEACSPLETHICSENGWEILTPLFICPGDFPDNFLESCDSM